jgi:hypothetical protein
VVFLHVAELHRIYLSTVVVSDVGAYQEVLPRVPLLRVILQTIRQKVKASFRQVNSLGDSVLTPHHCINQKLLALSLER